MGPQCEAKSLGVPRATGASPYSKADKLEADVPHNRGRKMVPTREGTSAGEKASLFNFFFSIQGSNLVDGAAPH